MGLLLLMLLQFISFADAFTGLINIMTDIIWRYTGDFMAPDIVCRVIRYLQVYEPLAPPYAQASTALCPHSNKL